MKNILLLKGSGVYGAIRKYVDEFAEGFRNLGYNTITLDLEQSMYKDKLEWIRKNYSIYAAVDCQGGQIKLELTDLYEEETTVMTYFCNHPLYHRRSLELAKSNSILCSLDQNHTNYINKYYPRFQYTGFVPLSGNKTDSFVPYEERKIDVIFTGSYEAPEEIVLKPEDAGNFAKRLRYEVWCRLLKSPWLTMEEALEDVLEQYQLSVTRAEFADVMTEIKDIEKNVRCYFRDKIIRTLLKENIPLTVFGEGWEKLYCEGRENLIIRTGDYSVSNRALGDAKIVLNIMPWFKDGFQERIAAGMLSGALVFSDTSRYIEQEFCDGADIMLYRLEKLENLPLEIKKMLGDTKRAAEIAERGRKKAEEKHTWKHRVRQMAELLEQAKGGVYVEPDETGKELSIEIEMKKSSVLKDLGIRFSEELNRFYALNENNYATNADTEHVVRCLLDINHKSIEKCQYEIASEQKLKLIRVKVREMNDYTWFILLLDDMLTRIKDKIRSVELEELLAEDAKQWNTELYDEMLPKVLYKKYKDSDEESIKDWMDSIRIQGSVLSYPLKLVKSYADFVPTVVYDKDCDLIYVWHNGKKMYYPREYSVEMVVIAYRFCCIEQDKASTHRYLDDDFYVEKDSVVIDAGAAEGNFALDVVDIAKKIYLVECEKKWLEALTHTFAPYKDKVTIIPKMLGNKDNDTTITIDAIACGEKVDFIKMDVEGAEADALVGAQKTLTQSRPLKCVVATYHKKGMEEKVKKYLQEMQFAVSTTDGYLFYKDYSVPVWENELRHGLVRAEKK